MPFVVLAVDFGGTKIAATVADPEGRRLGAATVQTVPATGARATFDLGVELCRSLLSRLAAGRPLAAVGACTFGIPHEDRVELAPTITGWADLAFGRELRAAFPGAHVRFATDVKCAARAEATSGALVGCDPGVYLNLGTGLAAAVVIGGTVVHGQHGAAGEIGYSLRRPADVHAAAPVILEQAVSGQALAGRAATTGWATPAPALDAEAIFARAPHDPAAMVLVDEFVDELAMHVVNLTALIDPARIAVGGGITRAWDQLGLRLQAAVDAHAPFRAPVVRAHHPFDAPLIGALAIAVEAARTARPTEQFAHETA